MATFQCQQCGNLHGAPVETCGICGSPAVMLVPDENLVYHGPPLEPPAPGAVPPVGAAEPSAAHGPDEFVAAIKPLWEEALEYIRTRDKQREDRHVLLDAAEAERRDRVAHAKLDFIGQATTLVEKLIELAEAATADLTDKRATTPIVE